MHISPEYQRVRQRQQQLDRITRPLQQFMATETAGGVVLLIATVVALVWANSPWSSSYLDLIHYHLAIDLGFWSLDRDLHFWINDAAMVIFFFVVGLEIKRESVAGELSNPRAIAVPIAGALGGMVAPALIFVLFTLGSDGSGGWGIPIATDIAFALGVLALVGSRVPFGLRVMLLALAIVDDIGGIIVIALFYTSDMQLDALGLAASTLVLAVIFRQSGIWYIPIYIALGLIGWGAAVSSGVHPTIIGVAFGLLAPWKAWYHDSGAEELISVQINRIRRAREENNPHAEHEQVDAMLAVRQVSTQAVPPLDRMERELQPLVAFAIVPIFAFANAGVVLSGDTLGQAISAPVTLGIFFGLLVGKPAGILLATFIATRFGAQLPVGVRWSSVLGMGILGGIGFTVSLLITDLSFTDEMLLTEAKLGILAASALAGIIGFLVLRRVHGGPPEVGDGVTVPATVLDERGAS